MSNGKGSKQRKRQVDRKTYESNWDAVFKPKRKPDITLKVLAGPFISTSTYPRWTSGKSEDPEP